MILQNVKAGNLKPTQKVRFNKKSGWWKVDMVNQDLTIIRRGNNTCRVSPEYPMLQEPFHNL